MFERQTVFIVGAGASREVKFPMGVELAEIIGRKLNITYKDGWNLSSGDAEIVEAVRFHLEQLGERDKSRYHQAGRAIASAMGQAISIDNYLHSHADDPLVVWMGKIAIAISILEAEHSSDLKITSDGEVDLKRSQSSWYNVVFQMIHEGVQRSDLSDIFKNISFITFNYDRCIEHYFVNALRNYYQIEALEAQELTRTLRIEHPYGQIGRLPWQKPNGVVPFGRPVQAKDLPAIAGQIRTFTERIEDEVMIQRMRALISEAQVVVYLGFSYGDMNMKLLSVPPSITRIVLGTTFGISDPNVKIIRRDIVDSLGGTQQGEPAVRSLELANLTCADFLRAYWRPILRG